MDQSESDDSLYADIEGFFDSDQEEHHDAESHSVNGATRLLQGNSDFRDASRHHVPP